MFSKGIVRLSAGRQRIYPFTITGKGLISWFLFIERLKQPLLFV